MILVLQTHYNLERLFPSHDKHEWLIRNMESIKYDVISKQQKVADVGLLYSFDKIKNQQRNENP